MSDMSYGNINDPRTRLDANLRRRQISQLLHVIAPAAAMCLVLTASPQVMFASAATWFSWPWNLLLAMAFGVLIWDVRALLLRGRRAREPLTLPVDSAAQAIRFAENALGITARPPGTWGHLGGPRPAAAGIWESYAVLPLAALAYAASQLQNLNSTEWLVRTVTGLASADSDDVWQEAAHAVATTTVPTLHSSFFRTMNMEQRQRHSAAVVMRDAILGANMAVQR